MSATEVSGRRSGRTAPERTDRGPSWATVLRTAASGGRGDRTRIALTATGAGAAALALLCAATVAWMGPEHGPYTTAALNEPGLHAGVVAALVLLCVPVLAFAGQCARVGAPARERRLAALRLQGATPGDVVRVVAAETGVAALLGSVAGTGLFLVLRAVLDAPVRATWALDRTVTYDNGSTGTVTEQFSGLARRLPTDVLPPWPALLAVVVAVPVSAALFAVLSMRRVAVTPFGVVRREQQRPVRVLPVVLLAVGTAGTAGFTALLELLGLQDAAPQVSGLLFTALLLATAVGLLLGTGALAAAVGAALAARVRRPALLLAGRRLVAAPTTAARTHAALLVVVLLAALNQGVRADLLAVPDPASSYAQTLALVDAGFVIAAVIAAAGLVVGAVEGVVSRRSVLAGMSATGVPRSTLHAAVLVETLLPLVAPVVLAATAGVLGARGILGTTASTTVFDAATGDAVLRTVEVAVPWSPLLVLVGAALGTSVLAVLAVLPLLQRSVQPSELRAG
ncbi:FtsX-like permease family protein [Kineococcus indalonis]|uniref:FtsX-like permease family protein n=1 Tax=Kineococcus indalonis TaxID=2696566 RepID=UPI001412F9CE|nr:FtsX-like permease family protein [Kineococcus indalonis]NAZ84542.1 ABC transporter permease [Kineococcus indalonis]